MLAEVAAGQAVDQFVEQFQEKQVCRHPHIILGCASWPQLIGARRRRQVLREMQEMGMLPKTEGSHRAAGSKTQKANTKSGTGKAKAKRRKPKR